MRVSHAYAILSGLALVSLAACAAGEGGGPAASYRDAGWSPDAASGAPGGCEPPEDCDPGSGVEPGTLPPDCQDLTRKVCGYAGGPDCDTGPACEAARLLQSYEPEGCASALDDDNRYPECRYGPCDQLVLKACGALEAPQPCEDAPGCAPAWQLWERAQADPSAEERLRAEESCRQSLSDDLAFRACDG
jgi:hypothetical protein